MEFVRPVKTEAVENPSLTVAADKHFYAAWQLDGSCSQPGGILQINRIFRVHDN